MLLLETLDPQARQALQALTQDFDPQKQAWVKAFCETPCTQVKVIMV
jgi:hypothetical protein